jgi:hypothetical protein
MGGRWGARRGRRKGRRGGESPENMQRSRCTSRQILNKNQSRRITVECCRRRQEGQRKNGAERMRQVFIIQPDLSQNRTWDFCHVLNRDPMGERAVTTLETTVMNLRENVKIKGTPRDARLLKNLPIDTC